MVSGQCSPDYYLIDKVSGQVLQQQLGKKEMSVWLQEGGGTYVKQGTVSEFSLLPEQVAQVTKLRRVLGALKDGEGASEAASLELLLDRMKTFKTNDEFLAEVGKASSGA